MSRKELYIVLTAAHAMELKAPAIERLVPNIIEYMREIEGGAVLVTIDRPEDPRRKVRWTIQRVQNSRDAARRCRWTALTALPNYEGGDCGATLIGGTFKEPPAELREVVATKRRPKVAAKRSSKAAAKPPYAKQP